MNKEKRARIAAALLNLSDLIEVIEGVCQEEQEAYDNLPESIQSSEDGGKMESAIGCLDNAASYLIDAQSELEAAIE